MDAKQIIRNLMVKTGTSQEKLAKKSGMKSQSNITGILNRCKSLRVDTLEQLIAAMGYKMMVVPDGVKCRDGWYEVSGDDQEGESASDQNATENLQTVIDVLSDIYPAADVSGIAIERISDCTPGSD